MITAGLGLLAGGIRWSIAVGLDRRRENPGIEPVANDAGSNRPFLNDSESPENLKLKTLSQALAEYDLLKNRFLPGALGAERLSLLAVLIGGGELDTSDCCRLLDHALPDLIACPEGGVPPSEIISMVLDLAASEEANGGESPAQVIRVIDWLSGLRNPRMQSDFLDGAGYWFGKRYRVPEALDAIRRIPTAGGRDRFAAAYLSEGLSNSTQPLQDYLDLAAVVGEGRFLSGFRHFPEGMNFSGLPELLSARNDFPNSRIFACILPAWGSADPDGARRFMEDCLSGTKGEVITSAVAQMVEQSTQDALLFVREFPPSAEKDKWLSDALCHSNSFENSDVMALAEQIGDMTLREKVISHLKGAKDPFSAEKQ